MRAQKFIAALLAAQCEHRAGGVFVAEPLKAEQTAPAVNIGHGFDVKNEHVHALNTLLDR